MPFFGASIAPRQLDPGTPPPLRGLRSVSSGDSWVGCERLRPRSAPSPVLPHPYGGSGASNRGWGSRVAGAPNKAKGIDPTVTAGAELQFHLGLHDLAANIEQIIVAGCAVEAASVASEGVRAPGSAARVTWATELEEVREFGAAESEKGASEPAGCVDDDGDDEEFTDCVELLPAPDAETLAAIASLRAVVRPGERGLCDVPALEQARRELKAAICRAAAEHEQKQENLLAQLKLRYAVAMAVAARVPLACAGAAGLPTATVGAAGLPAATVGAAGLPLVAAGAEGQPLAAVGAEEQPLAAAGAAEPSPATVDVAGSPQAAVGAAGLLQVAEGAEGLPQVTAASPVDDHPEEPSDTKLELPPPRKLKLFDAGWKSDDTKTFDTDRGREGDTHTHTHSSFFGKVVSLLL
eukprot:COSAG01_NODE_4033_length_5415_cov_22.663093_1_plen_409_part_00